MSAEILRAHFDGREIVLDEPRSLVAGTSLLITVLPASIEGSQQVERAVLDAKELASNHAGSEPEYTVADLAKRP